MDVIRETGYTELLCLATCGIAVEISLQPKKHFPIGCHCKPDVCKTVDMSPRTADEPRYDSLHSDFLYSWRLCVCKLFVNL